MDNEKFQELVLQQFHKIDQRLDEHASLLRALGHASEVHKADTDNLTHGIARVEGGLSGLNDRMDRVENDVKDLRAGQNRIETSVQEIADTNRSLLEMYGEHEAQIRTIRRR